MPNKRKGKSHSKKIERFKKSHTVGRKEFAKQKRLARLQKKNEARNNNKSE